MTNLQRDSGRNDQRYTGEKNGIENAYSGRKDGFCPVKEDAGAILLRWAGMGEELF